MNQVIKKPTVELIGEDGNVFSIIGRVSRALKDAGQEDRAKEYTELAFGSKSYDEVLALTLEYVEVATSSDDDYLDEDDDFDEDEDNVLENDKDDEWEDE